MIREPLSFPRAFHFGIYMCRTLSYRFRPVPLTVRHLLRSIAHLISQINIVLEKQDLKVMLSGLSGLNSLNFEIWANIPSSLI
jgi:hypothetical protein